MAPAALALPIVLPETLPIPTLPALTEIPTKAPVTPVPPTVPPRLIAVIVFPWTLDGVVVPAAEKRIGRNLEPLPKPTRA